MIMRRIHVFQLALLLILASVFLVGCGTSPSSVQSSVYPADMTGHVIFAEKVSCPSMDRTFAGGEWIVELSVNNKSYQEPMYCGEWTLIVKDEIGNYGQSQFLGCNKCPDPIAPGESAKVILIFGAPLDAALHKLPTTLRSGF